MKISTRLKLAALAPVLMALLIGLALLFSHTEMEKARESRRAAQQIMNGVNELHTLAHSYMLYHEERPKRQFLRQHDDTMLLLSRIRFTDREKELLEGIRENTESMKSSFLKLASTSERHGSGIDAALLREAEERLTGQLLSRSREVLSDAEQLENLIADKITATQRRINMLILFLIIATTVPLTIALIRTMSGIVASLAALQKGTQTIGAGNLDFKIQEKKNDEIGDLAHAFNQMTTNLRAVTASKADLEREIAERKRAETELQASRKFLEIANRHSDLNPLLQEFIMQIKELTYCAAVGIHLLDEHGNIPYMAYQGFSQQFYETESPLSINTDKCMCINVVKGTTDPGLPFYTKRGSFYMNGTTRFLATVSEKDKGETRNVCNQVGYESVALIPIRGDSHIMGLIHLADHKENMVPLSMVKLLEQAASALGAGIQRALAEEALRQSEQRWATTLASIGDGVIATDVEGRITFMNVVAEGLTGWTLSEASQKPVTEVFNIINEQTRKEVDNPVSKVLQAGNVVGLGNHTVLVSKDGTEVPIDDSGAPIRGESGNISGVVLVFRDITERKRAEEELRRHQDELEDRVRERTVELRESEERLRQLSTELLNAQEKERRAVAQEIHDSIGASLSAAKFKVESAIGQLSADAPQTKALLEGVIPIIQETANTTTLSL